MIDEYEYRRMREKHHEEFWTDTRIRLAVLGGVITILIDVATFSILLFR